MIRAALLTTLLAAGSVLAAGDALPLLAAHRGESHDAPENTHAAFDLAWKLGVQAIELDLHLTSDGKVVVCHDADTFRTTGKGTKLVIKESTWDQLRVLDVGAWKGAAFTGQTIPLFAEVLARMPAGRLVFIELKPDDLALVGAAVEVMKKAAAMKATGPTLAAMPVISFHAGIIAEFKRQWPDGPSAYLLAGFKQDEQTQRWGPPVAKLIADAKACGADGLDVQNKPPVDRDFVAQVHAAGLKCFVWTEDDPQVAARYVAAGIDGITTNRPAWLAQRLAAAR